MRSRLPQRGAILLSFVCFLLLTLALTFSNLVNLDSKGQTAHAATEPNSPTYPPPVNFISAQSYPTGASPFGIAVADFNGDGWPDIVTGSLYDQSISVHLAKGHGLFQAPLLYHVSGGGAVATGDFNQDGKADIVATTRYSIGVSILMGRGDGTFEPYQFYTTTQPAERVLVADFNGDGWPDIALSAGNAIAIMLNNADGSFGTIVTYPGPATNWSLVSGDFNGDGKLDLASLGGYDSELGIWLNNGSGVFQSAHTYIFNDSSYSLAVGDFNGDGKPDLVSATSYNAQPHIHIGNGDGSFQIAPNGTGGGALEYNIATADFNGDGKLDLAIPLGAIQIRLGNGDASFQPAANYVSTYARSNLLVADLNNDNKPDLISIGDSLEVILGHGDGSFEAAQSYDAGSYPYSLLSGDFDRDGKPDVITGNAEGYYSYGLSVLLSSNSSNGKLLKPPANYAPARDINYVTQGDFNGDGKPDLAAATYNNNLEVLLGNSDGTFGPATDIPIGTTVYWTAVSDFNGDGKQDIVILSSYNDKKLAVLLGNGDGTFQSPQLTSLPVQITFGALGDLNGDGKADLVIGGFDNSLVLKGKADGTFEQVATLPLPFLKLALRDVNGDNRLDLISTNTNLAEIKVMLGNGDLTFGPATAYPTGAVSSSMALGDLNGDGILDVAVASSTPSVVNVLVGKGDGTFNPPIPFLAGDSPTGIVITDLDNDGRPDLVVGNYYAHSVTVLKGSVPGPTTHFNLTTDLSDPAGQVISVTVQARAAYNGQAAPYTGTIHFTSSDNAATLPADYNFTLADNNSHTFSLTLNTLGRQIITATDIASNTINGKTSIAISGPPASITVFAGSPGSAVVGNTFNPSLKAQVLDGLHNPVKGATVQFTAPATEPTGRFALDYSGATYPTTTVTTDEQGFAAAPYLVAGHVPGSYTVTATISGSVGLAPANFNLTNLIGSASKILVLQGNNQSTPINSPFTVPFQVQVTDNYSNPISNTAVTFYTNAQAGKPSGLFANNSITVQVLTNAEGKATAPFFTANGVAGPYQVQAYTICGGGLGGSCGPGGSTISTAFTVTNLLYPPTTINPLAGNNQATAVNTSFAMNLQASVQGDNSVPISGTLVVFEAPANGASGTFAGNVISVTVTTHADGLATTPVFTANCKVGSYNITARTAGLQTSFALTNTLGSAAVISVTQGNGQTTFTGTTFATPLQVLVKDSCGHPLEGNSVTFSAPNSGASGSFQLGNNTTSPSVTVLTGADGLATSPPLKANSQAGNFNVTASVTGLNTQATFALVNQEQCNPLVVSSSTDDGNPNQCGTLTKAIATANQANTPVTISFSSNITEVIVAGQLPLVNSTNPVTIDGGCQLDNSGRGVPKVQIKAANPAATAFQLGTNVTLRGLRIGNFNGYGVTITGNTNRLLCNWLGTLDGSVAAPNGGGIHLIGSGATNNLIGLAQDVGTGNLSSGNNGPGLWQQGGTNNQLAQNWFGMSTNGQNILKNSGGNIKMSAGPGLIFNPGNRLRT